MQEAITCVQGFCVGAMLPTGCFVLYLKRWIRKDDEHRKKEKKKKAPTRAEKVRKIGFSGDLTQDNQWMKDSLAQEAAKIAASTGE